MAAWSELPGSLAGDLSSQLLTSEERLKRLLSEQEERIVEAVVREVSHLAARAAQHTTAWTSQAAGPGGSPAAEHEPCSRPTTQQTRLAPAEADLVPQPLLSGATLTEDGKAGLCGADQTTGGLQDAHGSGGDAQPTRTSCLDGGAELGPGGRTAGSSDEGSSCGERQEQPPRLKKLVSRVSSASAFVAVEKSESVACKGRMSKLERSTTQVEAVLAAQEAQGEAQNLAAWIVATKWFVFGIMALILLNIIFIGVQADFTMKNVHAEMPDWLQVSDLVFALAFSLEIVLRLCAEGSPMYSWRNPQITSNLFDTFLVATALLEEVLKRTKSGVPPMSAMRALRMFRFVRVARIVRVARMFSDLRIMVAGIMSSMKSLLWALLLLFLCGFMFSILVLELISMELYAMEVRPEDYGEGLDELQRQLREHWGSLIEASYTLYASISGGMDWGSAAGPLMQVHPLFGLMFCIYVAFAVFCVLNIVTGVFVENTKDMLNKDETHLILATLESRKQWLEEVKQLWSNFGCEGKIDRENFMGRVSDFRIQALFRRLGLEVEAESAAGLFDLIDFDASGEIEIDEFATGIQMLNGQAKSIDIARLQHQLRALQRQITAQMDGTAAEDTQVARRSCHEDHGEPRKSRGAPVTCVSQLGNDHPPDADDDFAGVVPAACQPPTIRPPPAVRPSTARDELPGLVLEEA